MRSRPKNMSGKCGVKNFPRERKKPADTGKLLLSCFDAVQIRQPLFSLAQKAQREKLSIEKRRGYFALCGGRGGLRALHRTSF
jgi:hypothetical protein